MIYGSLEHNSREGAIRAVRLFKHRLSVARISHLLSLLDLSNAFASLDNVHMDSMLTHFIAPEDHGLAMLRCREVLVTIDCPDGVVEPQPLCGGLQGDTLMLFMWLSAFASSIAEWQTSQCSCDCLSLFSISRSPTRHATEGSLTVYADYAAKAFFRCRMQGDIIQPQSAQQ